MPIAHGPAKSRSTPKPPSLQRSLPLSLKAPPPFVGQRAGEMNGAGGTEAGEGEKGGENICWSQRWATGVQGKR